MIRKDVPKIVHRDGRLAAAAGSASFCAQFLVWFLAGEKGVPPLPEATDDGIDSPDQALLVDGDGGLRFYESGGSFEVRAPYFAIGSGARFAFGAMFAGAQAPAAVRAGIEHDPFSGGDVTVLRVGT